MIAPFSTLPYLNDEEQFDPLSSPAEEGARVLRPEELSDCLVAPDSGQPLRRSPDGLWAADDGRAFPQGRSGPVLLPEALAARWTDGLAVSPEAAASSALLKYAYLSQLKQVPNGGSNLPHTDVWYLRYMARARRLLQTSAGTVLDIGCDDPRVSRKLFPSSVRYVGVDPGGGSGTEPVITAMAEFLPFRVETFDCACFMTSLDHVLDYHRAIDEAWRVLKPGGSLYVSTLVWTARADLLGDAVHFHHFREYELLGALGRFTTTRGFRYGWKGNTHRYGVYLEARKEPA